MTLLHGVEQRHTDEHKPGMTTTDAEIVTTHDNSSWSPEDWVTIQTLTFLDDPDIAGVVVERFQHPGEPWSPWGVAIDVSDDDLTAGESLVLAAALRNAALRARELNEVNS